MKEIKLGSALVFENLDIKLNTEIIDIIKGFVILGSEILNSLNDTDSGDTKVQSPKLKEKGKLQTHKFKVQIDSHIRVLFPAIKLTISSSDVKEKNT